MNDVNQSAMLHRAFGNTASLSLFLHTAYLTATRPHTFLKKATGNKEHLLGH